MVVPLYVAATEQGLPLLSLSELGEAPSLV